MTRENSELQDVSRRLLETAKAVLDGNLGIVEGCRQLAGLGAVLDQPLPSSFDVLIAVDSETDDYPLGPVRDRYSVEALVRIDDEVERYVHSVRPAVLAACRDLVDSPTP